jgi:hypothetical protein
MQLHNLHRNFAIWTTVTILCASPSLQIASKEGYNFTAMILGIIIIICGYSFASSTDCYQNIRQNKQHLHKALKIAFCLKIVHASLGLLIDAIRGSKDAPFLLPDYFLGLFSLAATKNILNIPNENGLKEFAPTLMTTLIQATFVSIVILLADIFIWIIIRIAVKVSKKGTE